MTASFILLLLFAEIKFGFLVAAEKRYSRTVVQNTRVERRYGGAYLKAAL
jgi:hypothetical protein